ncbi:MAG: hypothetical protein Pg6C_05860 [Treponemataceae bacterium]|nr:MAG: hypothetical protein Pg6C_05860 [Treponemataceae bacterium]
MRKEAQEKIPWHPAFVQALQLELEDYADELEFKAEYQLTSEPLRIDIVVIKKKAGVTIDKNIGRIFRTHNIIEYKSPRDSFAVSDLYKAFVYVFLYAIVEGVDIRDCSLTLASVRKPAAAMGYLQTALKHRVEKTAEGMYYVHGRDFPIQIIETRRLSEQENVWLANLRDDLTAQSAEKVLAAGGKRRGAGIAAYLYALMTARGSAFQEAWDMKKQKVTFEQLWRKIGEESGQLEELRQEGIVQGVHQTKLETARKMRNLGIPAETIGQVTDLSPADIAAL